LFDAPQATTTYRITIMNAAGEQDTEAITVRVK
jgi:hypothetical protein